MPGPAARIGDQTAHGGVIVGPGVPNVLIGGKPASVLGDMHTCPMQTPAPVPVPHVGGPVSSPGAPTVLIMNRPAATIGSICVCVGPPDSIIVGAPNVILGAAGAGSASSGSGGGGGGGGAQASAQTAILGSPEATTEDKNWIKIEFVDKAGLPVSGVAYEFTDPGNKKSEGVLRLDGAVRRDALKKEGEGKVVLLGLSGAKWSKDKAKVGEKVELSAKAEGFEAGTKAAIQVFKRDLQGPDVVVDHLDTQVKSDKIEAEWQYDYPEEAASLQPDDAKPYAYPQFYFVAIAGRCTARSGLLDLVDEIELDLVDSDDQPLRNEPFVITFSNGEVRQGRLNGNGHAKLENVPLAHWSVRFPNLPDVVIEG